MQRIASILIGLLLAGAAVADVTGPGTPTGGGGSVTPDNTVTFTNKDNSSLTNKFYLQVNCTNGSTGTADAALINAAITTATAAGGGTIKLVDPCTINAQITVPSNVTVQSDGSLFLPAAASNWSGSAIGDAFFCADSAHDVTIKGFYFDWTGAAASVKFFACNGEVDNTFYKRINFLYNVGLNVPGDMVAMTRTTGGKIEGNVCNQPSVATTAGACFDLWDQDYDIEETLNSAFVTTQGIGSIITGFAQSNVATNIRNINVHNNYYELISSSNGTATAIYNQGYEGGACSAGSTDDSQNSYTDNIIVVDAGVNGIPFRADYCSSNLRVAGNIVVGDGSTVATHPAFEVNGGTNMGVDVTIENNKCVNFLAGAASGADGGIYTNKGTLGAIVNNTGNGCGTQANLVGTFNVSSTTRVYGNDTGTGFIAYESPITNTETLTKSSGSTGQPFGLEQTLTVAGSSTVIPYGFADYMVINDTLDSTGQSSGIGVAGDLAIVHNQNGGKGGRTPLWVQLNGGTTGETADRNFVGITSAVNPTSQGGINGTNRGLWYSFNGQLNVPVTATYVDTASNELDITNNSASLGIKDVLALISIESSSSYQGTLGDYALTIAGGSSIGSGAPGWKCGICFGGYSSYLSIATTGTIFSDWANANSSGLGLNVGTVGSIMDFHDLTVSNYIFNMPNFTVTGAGALTAASVASVPTAAPTTDAGNVASTGLQGAIPVVIAGSGYVDATGTYIIGGTPSNSATISFSGTSGSVTATFSAATLLGTASDVGRVIVVRDTTYKICTITAQSSTTVATCTLGATLSGTGPFTNANTYLTGLTASNTVSFPVPLRIAYANAYFYVPAISAVGVAEKVYGVCSSIAVCVLYNNVLTTGTPTVPGSPTAFSGLTPGAFTQSTSIQVMLSYTVAANVLGNSGALGFDFDVTQSNDNNSKTATVLYGTNGCAVGATTLFTIRLKGDIAESGTNASQICVINPVNTTAIQNVQNNTISDTSSHPATINLTLANQYSQAAVERYAIVLKPN